MTKFDINKAIADFVGAEYHVALRSGYGDCRMLMKKDRRASELPYFDYCNNWNDLMPLVVEYGITWNKYKDGYHAIPIDEDNKIYDFSLIAINKDLQRALAECLLKVLQGE